MANGVTPSTGPADRYANPSEHTGLIDFVQVFDGPYPMVIVGLLVLLVLTRGFSSLNSQSKPTEQDGVQTVPAVPYWLPVLGHIPPMVWNAERFVKSLRNKYTNSIFALNFGGSSHNVLHPPGLATALLNQKPGVASSEDVSARIMRVVFGFPGNERQKYDDSLPDLNGLYKHLLSEPSLGDLVSKTASAVKHSLKDLVTGNESIVDQMPWERTSNTKMALNKSGDPVVEASLLPLIRDYVATTANPAIMGSDFLNNFPTFFADIWVLDKGFLLLAAGLPRWVPIPSVTRAHIARKRILEQLEVFHTAMEKQWNGEDPGPKWSSLNDVGSLVKARMDVYRKHGFSMRARAACEHSLLWAGNANSDTLIFWILNRIYADKSLLAMIREEIEPYVKITVPDDNDFLIAEPPRLDNIDVEGLCNNCPLLKSCYIESLRIDVASWSLREIKQDLVLRSRSASDKDDQGWLLRKGEYAHVAHDLHSTDPKYFPDPEAWRADRHIKHDGQRQVADVGTIRPYGGGSSMCKGRAFALKQIMLYTAAIISMWEFEPAEPRVGSGRWKMPRHKKATGTYTTSDDTRVWVKRRDLTNLSEEERESNAQLKAFIESAR